MTTATAEAAAGQVGKARYGSISRGRRRALFWSGRRSRGTLQLSTRCSSLALPPSRSLAVRIGWTPLASPLARSIAPGAAKVASKISVHATTWAPAGNIIRGELAIGSFRFDCIGTLGLVGPDWRCLVRRASLFCLSNVPHTLGFGQRCAPRSVSVALRCLAGCLRGLPAPYSRSETLGTATNGLDNPDPD